MKKNIFFLVIVLFFLFSCSGNGKGVSPIFINGPEIVAKNPQDGKSEIEINTAVSVTFSQEMSQVSVEKSFLLIELVPNEYNKEKNVSGTFSWQGATLIFTPAQNLNYDSEYEARISDSANDLTGINLRQAHHWYFKTKKNEVLIEPKPAISSSPEPSQKISSKVTPIATIDVSTI